MNETLTAYLMSNGEEISVVFKKPQNMRGALGVYDLSNDEHLRKFVEDVHEHSLALNGQLSK
jgi:hypothetical protein